MKIIDVHTHAQDILFPAATQSVRPSKGLLIRLFEWRRFNILFARSVQRRMRERIARETQGRNAMASFEGLLKEMQRAGITHSVVLPVEPYGNSAEVLSFAEKEKRILPFASVDPHDPGMTEKLRRYVQSGCRGLKLHPIIQDFHPSGRECMEAVEEFKQYGLPVFFHSGQTAYYVPESVAETYGAPEKYVKLFAAFPSVTFVMGHMGMTEAREAIEIAQVFENIYFDTSFQPKRMVKTAVERIGGDRIMFGTDWPFARQRFELGIVMDLTEGNPWLRERVLWKNAEELIGGI